MQQLVNFPNLATLVTEFVNLTMMGTVCVISLKLMAVLTVTHVISKLTQQMMMGHVT
jgi:hypothetical protein